MTAYYNEIDLKAAAWLRELIRRDLIAPGDVDERSIEDVAPDDLRSYAQCHFFAGIGVWSYALRRAGWPDDHPVWTGSCPCQPFSAAGKGGGFDDERHLWPHFHYLIEQCGPPVVFGEQVASKVGLAWLDLVQADMEGAGYAAGAVDLCAAGVGAPHIRQRLWWVGEHISSRMEDPLHAERRTFDVDRENGRNGPDGRWQEAHSVVGARSEVRGLGHDNDERLEGQRGRHQAESGWVGAAGPVASAGQSGGVDNPDGRDTGPEREQRGGQQRQQPEDGRAGDGRERPGPTNGLWRDADWLFCRDGKWRPVEPGTFPLAHGAPERVGRLRGYGNAIVAPAAQAFIEAYLETREERAV